MKAAQSTELLIRADAGTDIGVGHLMRCLALGQSWKKEGGQVTFVTSCESDDLRKRLSGEGFEVIALERAHPASTDWTTTSHVLAIRPKAWVVLEPGQSASKDDLIEYCKDHLAAYEIPRRYDFVEALPKSAVGKTLRRELVLMETEKNGAPEE